MVVKNNLCMWLCDDTKLNVVSVYPRGRFPEWYNKTYGHLCAAEVARIRDSFTVPVDKWKIFTQFGSSATFDFPNVGDRRLLRILSIHPNEEVEKSTHSDTYLKESWFLDRRLFLLLWFYHRWLMLHFFFGFYIREIFIWAKGCEIADYRWED